MSTLIAITYDTADKATQALEKLGELQKMQLVTLEDAAVAVKDEKGKVKVTPDSGVEELTAKNIILATGARLGIPVTVHVAIGTDILHMHPGFDPQVDPS